MHCKFKLAYGVSYCTMGQQKSDLIVALQGHISLRKVIHNTINNRTSEICCTACSHKPMEGHTAQWGIPNPICDSCTARSLKPMEGHSSQSDTRNPICDSCTARSPKLMEGHSAQLDISVILALQGRTSLWSVIVHNWRSEIRSVILAL